MSKSGNGLSSHPGEQGVLFEQDHIDRAMNYPKFRYMGSKHKLTPWIYKHLKTIKFNTVLDGFAGSGVVSYLLKSMGKEVYSNDFLNFSFIIAKATCENSKIILTENDVKKIAEPNPEADNFISATFENIFFTKSDLDFLDQAYSNINHFENEYKKALGIACLIRSCLKKQPRGVFTVSGDLSNYDDGRRDLKLSLKEHFIEQVPVFNDLVFDNGQTNKSFNSDIFKIQLPEIPDLVYLDPPYVPRSDDNCYVKRYHFVEGLSKYWKDEKIMEETKVKKIQKKHTPFSYRSKSIEAFEQLFEKFGGSKIVLSYSSNGYPDLEVLISLLSKHKRKVDIIKKPHKYHFGNHSKVKRSIVEEYLIIGQ